MKKEIMSHTGRNSSTMSHFIWVIFTLSVLLLQNSLSAEVCTWQQYTDKAGEEAKVTHRPTKLIVAVEDCKKECEAYPGCVAVDFVPTQCNIFTQLPSTSNAAGRTFLIRQCVSEVSTQGTTQAPGGTPVPVGGGSPDAGIAVTTLMPGSQTVGTVAPGPNAAGPDGSNLLSQLTPDDGFALMPTATDYIPPGPAPTSPPPTTTTVPTTTTPTTTTTQAPTTTEAPTTTTTTTTTTRPPPLPFTQPPIMEPVGGPRWTGGNYHLGPGNQGLPYTQPHVPNNKNIWNYKPPGPGRPMNMDWMWLLLMNHEA